MEFSFRMLALALPVLLAANAASGRSFAQYDDDGLVRQRLPPNALGTVLRCYYCILVSL